MGTKRAKTQRRLEARRKDFDRGPQSPSQDVQGTRWRNGGYHRPGSNNK
jgi:hypothetical protein